jgi:hypothetical protein
MEEYLTSITYEVNGQQLEDFNAFTEKERVFKKTVNLMNTTGIIKVKGRHHFSLDYVVPATRPEFNFEGVEDGTVTIAAENGSRISFGQVSCLSVGEAKYDGDKEVTKTIEFVAGTRNEE